MFLFPDHIFIHVILTINFLWVLASFGISFGIA